MARARNRGSQLGRLLDSASQPLYILDEDRRIVFWNSSFRRWLGAEADELIGRRCAYHSSPEAAGVDALAARLCPPPAAFSGKRCMALVSHVDDRGQTHRRRATFLPLGDVAELIAIVAVVDDLDVPEDFQLAEEALDPPPTEAQQLHEQLRRFREGQPKVYAIERLVGTSSAARRIRSQVAVAAESRASVTIVGPVGSGKERVARTIHYAGGPENCGAIIPLDCAVLGGDLVRSTVVALAAQDSETEHPGCNTLLLSSIDTISREVQAQLAHVLFERPFPLRTMATSTDRLTEGAARDDHHAGFAFGLGTLEIEIPPLADREEDLPLIAQALVEEINAAGGKQLGGLASEAIDLLTAYHWPDNIDELAAAVAYAHKHAEGPSIRPEDLPESIRLSVEAAAHPRREQVTIQLDEFLAEIERELIQRAMVQAKGNKTKAANLLGLNRPRLYRRLVQVGLIEAESDPSDSEEPATDE